MRVPGRYPLSVPPRLSTLLLGAALLTIGGSCAPQAETPSTGSLPNGAPPTSDSYHDLVRLFGEWRELVQPEVIDGVPDYSADAMAKQYRELDSFRDRLAAIDITRWEVAQKIDYELVRAEMNGLEFDHRVKQPWARDPAFYVSFYPSPTDVPAREGPVIHDEIDLSRHSFPFSDDSARSINRRLRTVPLLLESARVNLIGNARDLWISGTRSVREQSADLEFFAERVRNDRPSLAEAAEQARQASDAFADWLDERAPEKTGPSGVGKEEYTWNLQRVHLLPHTWEEQVVLMKRELARAHASLRLEENRNRRLEALQRIDSADEYDRRLNAAIDEYMDFLENEEIVSIRDYMDGALRARIGRFVPADGLRGFFDEVGYRDELVMRTHHYHWIDLGRMANEPSQSPIRSTPLLYNIFDSRAEGLATGMEEMMMHAGLFDDRPRARELIWILLAQRAARALGGLYQHGGKMTLEEATKFADQWTPRGWLPWDGGTIQHEQQFYLRQPGYGTSYISGKIEIEKLMAEYARQKGNDFTLEGFMDDLNEVGVIPVSLIHWQLTGQEGDIASIRS